MKATSKILLIGLLLLISNLAIFSTKVNIPITNNGAWSLNTQPASVYNNGVVYFSWISKSGDLVISSYNQSTDSVKIATIATGFGTEDFASPSLLIRASGQILVFASKNTTESGYQCYRSTSTIGDVTAGFTSQTMTGYGINSTIPYAIGSNIVIFWRSKNNLGYTYITGANYASSTGALGAGTRSGFLNTTIANNYQYRDELTTMRAVQAPDSSIHMVLTQLGTGLLYQTSTIHYMKIKRNNTSLLFQKADGTTITTPVAYATPADIVYNTTVATNKTMAYDIAIENNKPVILYDAFNGENVNASSNPGTTSNHTYKIAKWTGTQWNSNTIVAAGDGLPITQYTAVGGKTFLANSYQVGGACFDIANTNIVYLSKTTIPGISELFKYETSDEGVNWSETETITTGTASNNVNIRPIQVCNSPASRSVDLLWLSGTYTTPTTYNMSVICRGQGSAAVSMSYNTPNQYILLNQIIDPSIRFSPLFVENRDVTLQSSNTSVAIITPEGKVKGVGAGSATITATLVSNSAITTSCQVIVEETPVFDVFMQRIVNEAFTDRVPNVTTLESNVTTYLSNLQANGSFPDVNYASTDRTNWVPLTHLDRMIEMALAYTHPSSSMKGNVDLKSKLDLMLQYWQSQAPTSTNWYQNEIAEPQRMGLFLILMKYAGAQNVTQTLFDNAIIRLRDKGGNPGSQTGANRVDVALHWMYRACLTADRNLLQTAMDYIYSPIEYTAGSEGIQYDNSYAQHGRQLHIGSYGEVFLNGVTTATMYAVGTQYAIPAQKLSILSKLVKDTYLSVFRGQNIFFNVIGRASTRPNATIKQGTNKIVLKMASIDPANSSVYNAANARFTGSQPAQYNVDARSIHFYNTDYSLHKRPTYSADLRMVSTRTIRNEYLSDNLEGKKQYFLSDGAMGLYVDGNEYENIFPVWNWAKIPGVTCPEFTDVPQLSTYLKAGQSDFVGGVSDSLNIVSVYKYNDTEFNINTSANKSWFFFNDEIVCLGSKIKSQATQKINTTINQTLLSGNVTVSVNGSQSTFANGSFAYDKTVDWVYHRGIGYYFPEKAKLDLSAQQQTGSWFDINGNYSSDLIAKDVFSLSIDHGVQPTADKYAYIIVPGLQNATQAQNYNVSDIEILANSDSLQAVHNKKTDVYGFVFLKSGATKVGQLIVETDTPCAVIVKDIENGKAVVYVADPMSSTNQIKLGISVPGLTDRRLITYQASSPNTGKSIKFIVDANTPLYTGRDISYDRSDWIITTNIQGAADDAVYGTEPLYIIDEDTRSSFVFLKPGKTSGSITAPTDYLPSFTIDMKKQNDMSFFVYRHRTYSNTTDMIRAKKVSFYGKNNEGDAFTPIISNLDIATNVSDVKVQLPSVQKFRYVKLEINDWDNVNGNTVQVSDFNLGYFGMSNFSEMGTGIKNKDISQNQITLYPNPINVGKPFSIRLGEQLIGASLTIHSLTGAKVNECKVNSVQTNLTINQQGVYIISVRKNNREFKVKAIVK